MRTAQGQTVSRNPKREKLRGCMCVHAPASMYSNTESHYSVIESKNHKGLLGKVFGCCQVSVNILTKQQWHQQREWHVSHITFMQLIRDWFCCMQMKQMYICWISGFCVWPTTSQDGFIMNWTEFQSALQGCHSINLLYDNLCVRERVGFGCVCCFIGLWTTNPCCKDQRPSLTPHSH